MTEQEAEALAERLTRIWEPDSPGEFDIRYRPPEWGIISDKEGFGFDYDALLRENIEFKYTHQTLFTHKHWFRIEMSRVEQGERTGFLGWTGGSGRGFSQDSRYEQESFQAFAREWMPFFRRGCWLSGCAIEASAHEKAEWMQGFTREELQAWNLKM